MKTKILTFFLIILSVGVFAQPSDSFNYQAIVRNADGTAVVTHLVSFRLSILKGSETGSSVYSETHDITTNQYGLATLAIGNGTNKTGNFDAIDWGADSYFLKVEIDPAGGSAYVDMGTSKLLSVPYALHAKTAESLTETDPVFGASVASGITNTDISNWASAYSWGNHAGLYRPISYVPSWTDITDKPTLFDGTWTSLTAKPTTLAGYGITDAMNTSHAANGITATNITNWSTAYSWGNHSGLYRLISYVPAWTDITSNPFSITSAANNQLLKYNSTSSKWENWTPTYLTSYTETDPVWSTVSTNYYTKTNMQTSGSSQLHFNNITNKPTTLAGYGITDAMNTSHAANGITTTDITDWSTAYSWGNHSGLYRPIGYVPAWNEITSNPFSITSAENNQLLRYNSTSSKWENWTANFLTTTGSAEFLTNFPILNQNTTGSAASFTGSLIGDVTGNQNATVIGNAAVISKVLTGFSSAPGTITASDNILQAIQKLNGNDAINADLVGDVTSSGNTTTIANKVTMTATLPVSISGSPTVISSGAVSISIAPATGSSAGSMSAADKTKLDNMTSSSYYLGEAKDGGIIFNLYKGSDGQEHGLIVALVEATATVWQSPASLVNANRTWDGAYNTGLMTNSPAKTYVQGLGAGWYLPSIDELNILRNNRFYVNPALSSGGGTLLISTYYWSSTESSSTDALYINFTTGLVGNGAKTGNATVRAIRSF